MTFDRYPDIAFHLAFSEKKEAKPLQFDPAVPGDAEILYFFGLDSGEAFHSLLPWLMQKSERALIFLEEEISRFQRLPPEMVDHPQVHLKYVAGDWESAIEEMAARFPSDKLLCSAPQKAKFQKLKLQLLRSSGALSALYSDVLYSHKLFSNLAANFPRLLEGFDANRLENAFRGTPAIICGAGPSLEKSLPLLRECTDRALILAGGSAIPALLHAGIHPHLTMALDPNPEELERLSNLSQLKAPLLISPRLQKDVLSTFEGPVGYLYSATGGLAEEWLRKTLDMQGEPIGGELGREAFSVTTLALAYAHFLGCDPIYLVGVDLAYAEGRRYAPGISASAQTSSTILDHKMRRKNTAGKMVETQLKWVMEADALADFAKGFERRYFNVSRDGLPIKGFAPGDLSALLENKKRDLPAEIEKCVKSAPLVYQGNWKSICRELQESLERCKTLCSELEHASGVGKKTLLALNLSEEPSFDCFLEGIDAALERVLERYEPDEQKREKAKWREMVQDCERFSASLNTH